MISQINYEVTRNSGSALRCLAILHWYLCHRLQGGVPDVQGSGNGGPAGPYGQCTLGYCFGIDCSRDTIGRGVRNNRADGMC